MKARIVFIILIAVLTGCELLRDSSDPNVEPEGWFTVLSDSLVSFDDDEHFHGLHISNLYFLDENHGWVTGRLKRNGPDRAYVASTDDGGRNWTFNFIDDYWNAGDLYFFDMATGMIASKVIHRTTDGGHSWTHRMIRTGEPPTGVKTIEFQNQTVGWASGSFGAVAKTTNSGVTWNYLDLGYDEAHFASISILDNHVRILNVLDPGRLLSTSDGGDSWQSIPLPSRGENDPHIRFHAVHFTDGSHGWLTGAFRHIFYTDDGGATWTLQYPERQQQIDSDAIISIDTHDGQNVLALTTAGAILSSKDAGQTWEIQMPRNNNGANSTIQFINEDVAYAVNGNRVLKTVTRGEKGNAP